MAPRTSRSEAFLQEVAPFLEEWAEHGVTDRWQQFRNWSAQQVLWEYGLPFADIEEATRIDGPRDKGIDAWYFDEEYDPPRLILIQAKDQQPKRDDFSKLKDGFLDVVLPGRPKGASLALLEKAALFREQMPKAFKLDVYLTSSVIAQQTLQPDEDGSPLYPETLQVGESIADASYYVRDIKYLVKNIRVINNDPIDCTFHVDQNSRFVFDMGGHTKTVCAAIDGAELARLFSKHRQNLFRKNPRYYLLSTAANKQIKNSLLESQADFFLFNNGLTCVAHTIRVSDNPDDTCDIEVNDFQIVNGCQTAASIWSAFNEQGELNNVRVLAKIVENPRTGSEADRVSELIAERSNTQNPLKPEDWKSNDRRQQKWHELFQRLPEPWFYEIKRGTWATEYAAASDREPFRIAPRQFRKVSMKDLGQACYAFLGHPGEAMDKSRDVFNKPVLYETVFQEDLSPSQLLLPYLVYQEADKETKDHPEFKLPDVDGEAFSIDTRYLRFPIVAVVGRMLSTLAGQEQGYLSPPHSDQLIRNITWLPVFTEIAFSALGPRLATESRNKGTGARSIVRRNDWMAEALTTATDRIRDRMKWEKDMDATGEKALSSILPF